MDGLTDVLLGEHPDADALLANFFRSAPKSPLGPNDFPHLRREFALAARFLRAVAANRTAGVNILLYGPPGTGKTEFARMLAGALDAGLYAVNVEDEQGGAASRDRRLASYQLCQRLLSRTGNALVLFDECEDAFPSDGAWTPSSLGSFIRPGYEKGWTTHLLESNAVPTLWISNEPRYMDPAYLRRFDIAVELANPPVSVRRSILQKRFAELPLPNDCIERVSRNEHVTPADLDRVARIVRLIGADEHDAASTVEDVIGLRLALRGQPAAAPRRSVERDIYDLSFVRADRDLAGLAGALKACPRASICLYGPPGTGKSAYVRFVAERLQLPLVVRRASDLLDCLLGNTEKNIALMFREAQRQNAVLLLDEADSFLRDRRGAHRSWEVTQVNELLVQIECFDGLFFCATNLFADLDDASLRRFDFKVRFDFLSCEQRATLFRRMLEVLGAPPDDERDLAAVRTALRRLDNLTPGDFATVRRQSAVLRETLDAVGLLARLEAESRAKRAGRQEKAIGFGT
jgi:transitional endoplasmic reticulum ATPase